MIFFDELSWLMVASDDSAARPRASQMFNPIPSSASASMSESPLDKLGPAMAMLRDSKDESKFVGLLLISKAITPKVTANAPAPPLAKPKPAAPATAADFIPLSGLRSHVPGPDYGPDSDDELDEEEVVAPVAAPEVIDPNILQAIFDAVGHKFLARLLKSTKGEHALVSQRLGLNILSTLCMHAPIAVQCRDLMPEAVAVLQFSLEDSHVIDDAARFLLAVHDRRSDDRFTLLALSTFLSALKCASLSETAIDLVLQLVEFLIADYSNLPDLLRELPELMSSLSTVFASCQSMGKFHALRIICALLPLYEAQPHTSQQSSEWHFLVRRGLRDVLFSRVRSSFKNQALRACLSLLRLRGEQWATQPHGSEQDSAIFTSGQFVQMMFKLVTVEVRVLLETGTVDVDHADSLCACFALVELAIQYLTSEDEVQVGSPWVSLPPTILLSLQASFTELFRSVFIYLTDARDDGAPVSVVIVACIRALGSWLAEETSELSAEFVDILPFLLSVTDHPDQPTDDAVSFLIPALVHMLLSDNVDEVDRLCSILCTHHVHQRALNIVLAHQHDSSVGELNFAAALCEQLLQINAVSVMECGHYAGSLQALFDLFVRLATASDAKAARARLFNVMVLIVKHSNQHKLLESDAFWAALVGFVLQREFFRFRSEFDCFSSAAVDCISQNGASISQALQKHELVSALLQAASVPKLIPSRSNSANLEEDEDLCVDEPDVDDSDDAEPGDAVASADSFLSGLIARGGHEVLTVVGAQVRTWSNQSSNRAFLQTALPRIAAKFL